MEEAKNIRPNNVFHSQPIIPLFPYEFLPTDSSSTSYTKLKAQQEQVLERVEQLKEKINNADSKAFSGDDEALFSLGCLLAYKLLPSNRDYTQALDCFNKVTYSIPEAWYQIGKFHELGWGVERNMETAIQHYRFGAEQNEPHALLRLANFQLLGIFMEQNVQKGLSYFDAAVCLFEPSKLKIIDITSLCNLFEIDNIELQLKQKALSIIKTLVEHENPMALRTIGKLKLEGKLKMPLDTASNYLTRAVNLGDAEAILLLAMIQINKNQDSLPPKKIIELAEKYFLSAANQGDPEAQYLLARALENTHKKKQKKRLRILKPSLAAHIAMPSDL